MNEQTVKVIEIEKLTPKIKRLRLVNVVGKKLAPFSPGSHVGVEIPWKQKTRRNAYSLCSSPYETSFYDLAVLVSKNSRGGSQYLHQIAVGTKLNISLPNNYFYLNSLARKYILIAGGIGITPLLSMLIYLNKFNAPVELHYAAKSPKECAFYQFLLEKYSSQVTDYSALDGRSRLSPLVKFYFSEKGDRLKPTKIFQNQPLGTHLYLCAPYSLMQDCCSAAQALGYPSSAIHRELFGAVKTQKIEPFTAVLAQSEKSIKVLPDKTLLEALETAGIAANYSCRAGGCGACEVKVIEGEINHLDSYYTTAEKAEQNRILTCVSRAKNQQLVIDL